MSEATASGLSAEDREKIEEISRNFAAKMREGDRAAVAKLYTADGILMPPNHAAVSGQSTIREFLDTFPRITHFSITNDEIDGCGNIAYVRGRFEMTLDPGDGEPMSDQGKFLEIRRRQADGSWPLAVDVFNSDNG